MLEQEGFYFDRYIDVFDGGPTVTTEVDEIRTICESRSETVCAIEEDGKSHVLVASGRLKDFRACCARVKKLPKKGVAIDRSAAEMLEVAVGDQILVVAK
jgi:arginine N-succinyltransferase